jgi:hypothetical protein
MASTSALAGASLRAALPNLAQVAARLVAQFFLAHAENVTPIISDVDSYPWPTTNEITCSGCKDMLASAASIT